MSDEKDSREHDRRSKTLTTIAVLAIGIIAAALVTSQAFSNATAQTNGDVDDDDVRSTVSTSGTATTKVDPDKVSVTVGVETDGATASDAVANNTELMDKVIQALKALGITDDQLSTNYFSVYPTYDYQYPPCILEEGAGSAMTGSSSDANSSIVRPEIYPPPPECQPKNVITGYRASNSLTVTLDGNADVGKVIDTAVGAGANNVGGAYFFVSQERQEQIREDLIEKAIANAESRANKAAAAAGLNVTGVKSINLNDVYFPRFEKALATADGSIAGSTPILPGEQVISMTVQVTYFIG
ncbi:MAG: SIMPL domain-containing protein [Nitrososphaera sp.]